MTSLLKSFADIAAEALLARVYGRWGLYLATAQRADADGLALHQAVIDRAEERLAAVVRRVPKKELDAAQKAVDEQVLRDLASAEADREKWRLWRDDREAFLLMWDESTDSYDLGGVLVEITEANVEALERAIREVRALPPVKTDGQPGDGHGQG